MNEINTMPIPHGDSFHNREDFNTRDANDGGGFRIIRQRKRHVVSDENNNNNNTNEASSPWRYGFNHHQPEPYLHQHFHLRPTKKIRRNVEVFAQETTRYDERFEQKGRHETEEYMRKGSSQKTLYLSSRAGEHHDDSKRELSTRNSDSNHTAVAVTDNSPERSTRHQLARGRKTFTYPEKGEMEELKAMIRTYCSIPSDKRHESIEAKSLEQISNGYPLLTPIQKLENREKAVSHEEQTSFQIRCSPILSTSKLSLNSDSISSASTPKLVPNTSSDIESDRVLIKASTRRRMRKQIKIKTHQEVEKVESRMKEEAASVEAFTGCKVLMKKRKDKSRRFTYIKRSTGERVSSAMFQDFYLRFISKTRSLFQRPEPKSGEYLNTPSTTMRESTHVNKTKIHTDFSVFPDRPQNYLHFKRSSDQIEEPTTVF